MPLRKRISLVAAATVAVAVAIAILISYFAVRDELVGQIDNELTAQAELIQNGYKPGPKSELPGLAASAGGSAPYFQFVRQNGGLVTPPGQFQLPATKQDQWVANGTASAFLTDVEVDGARLRVYTFQMPLPPSDAYSGQTAVAIQLARPLAPVENVLHTLRWVLALVFLLVVGLAALLARMATRRVMKPLAEVTATAKLIGETDDLSQRIEVREDDEVGQLATHFNEMLERLESSRDELDASVTAQRQLVADASHELRTPVTSLRTNIEVLLSGADLDEEDRNRLLADVVEQSEELSALVSDLIEVARGDAPPTTVEDTRLDRLVEEAVDRARRNAPHVDFVEHLMPISVQCNPERLVRAVNNLLDNAALHAGHGGPVEITVDATGVTVRDHGDGIGEIDLPHVFDRFYRGANSRARQGSGLGLAIVRQVAEQHRGQVTAANAADGGAVFTLELPTTAVAGAPVGFAEPASVVANDARVARDAEVSA
jgi:two-component system, OmpR family, sensor histidine kinase MprB